MANPYVSVAVLFFASFIILILKHPILALIPLGIAIYKTLSILGLIRKCGFFRGSFVEGVVFTKDYIGPYSNNQIAFQEALRLIRNFKLKDYVIIAIYYDLPENDDKNLKYSVGVYRKNVGFPEKPPAEFERYCNENGYNQTELPNATSLYSSWEFHSFYTLKIGIKKFYDSLKQNLNDDNFKRAYKIRDASLLKTCIELYESESLVSFHVPLLFADKFNVFKKDK